LGGFVAEAQRRVAAQVHLPPNSFITWGGEFENQRRAMARLAIIVPVSIALILAILVRTFGSLACALLILATIPFALVGGVVGLETQRPLAVVVIGGLVSATLLTLLVLPVLYTMLLPERAAVAVPRRARTVPDGASAVS